MNRLELIKMIHVAKANTRECSFCGKVTVEGACPECREYTMPLSEPRYRRILRDLTGKESTKFMADDELEKVYSLFKEAGFSPLVRGEDEVAREYYKSRKKTIGVILSLAKKNLGQSWEERLEGFVFSKTGKKKLYELDDNQLRQVVGWLRRSENGQARETELTVEYNNKEDTDV